MIDECLNVPFPVISDFKLDLHHVIYLAVDRGLFELRKLGLEQQLWEVSRKEIDQQPSATLSNHKDSENSFSLS